MIKASLVGDWAGCEIALTKLSKYQLLAKAQLLEDGRMTLEQLVGHIDRQDLGWKALAESTVRQKDNSSIYIDSGFLRNNLTRVEIDDFTVYVGATDMTHEPSGLPLHEILIFQEYGTSTQPARPLLRPTFEEMKPIIQKNWEKLFKNLL